MEKGALGLTDTQTNGRWETNKYTQADMQADGNKKRVKKKKKKEEKINGEQTNRDSQHVMP